MKTPVYSTLAVSLAVITLSIGSAFGAPTNDGGTFAIYFSNVIDGGCTGSKVIQSFSDTKNNNYGKKNCVDVKDIIGSQYATYYTATNVLNENKDFKGFTDLGVPVYVESKWLTNTDGIYYNKSGKNVGIGAVPTTTEKLTVSGQAKITGNTGIGTGAVAGIRLTVQGKTDITGATTIGGNTTITGSVAIGTGITASRKLYVQGNLGVSSAVYANNYFYSSDIRLKKDIKTIQNPLEKILTLKGYEYTWKADDQKSIGLIAQEVERVFPELVGESVGPDGGAIKTVQYGNLVAPIIEAIRELDRKYADRLQKLEAEQQKYQSEVDSLREEIKVMRSELTELKQSIHTNN